ncbi:helix-turn-helix domain-containing protein [Enterococcus faecalis]|uniref:helix-turn-helix domain-containing protein n=1 Tax=Enterococcus faecalis TaxID=1351 RepID=UPI00215D0090|nr:helix-turn-helix transcriptional regulator [Enterococcus faecalis]
MQNLLTELGTRIRELRLSRKMTQQELAERCELSLPFINLIENNKRNVSLETLVKILTALDISLSDFFRPYSIEEDEDSGLPNLIELIQSSANKEDYIEMFTKILRYAKK